MVHSRALLRRRLALLIGLDSRADFVFNRQMYDVLEVNETSFESCNSQGFISNITRGGRDVFQLKEAKTYYFICSRGYCWGGMKVFVDVVVAPPAPTPSPSGAARSLASLSLVILPLIVTSLLSLKPTRCL
ncbi:hypothetical protein BT93_L3656 [Corymbia citriodora subsp. variegata]|uniref:Phytocyanin domain-containing protein n=1 Tax=Corymbia citriodora subsp. variegata TaxID=360336 RepID=A0A8T0CVV8_CORYI|nr:hypothetical protein BT93_L3656 [Corymbia citriodora subsp. variegata]